MASELLRSIRKRRGEYRRILDSSQVELKTVIGDAAYDRWARAAKVRGDRIRRSLRMRHPNRNCRQLFGRQGAGADLRGRIDNLDLELGPEALEQEVAGTRRDLLHLG